MELRQEQAGWDLVFHDGLVQQIKIDFRLGLLLTDDKAHAEVVIETPFVLHSPDGSLPVTPAEAVSLAPILPLFNARVISVTIWKTGHLRVEFADGYSIGVDPDDSYEAWQVGGSMGFMFICSPGGSVSLFREPVLPNPQQHVHVNDPAGKRLGINGNVVDPKSPDAHLPIGNQQ